MADEMLASQSSIVPAIKPDQHGDYTMEAKRNVVLPRSKKYVFTAIIMATALVLFEAGARIIFFTTNGFNPYYLTYGFAPDVEWNANQQNGYTKFFPNTTRHMMVRGRVTGMNINSSGFRSRHDFLNPKPPGVLRIATLGGSSTFGYEDEDEETYPYILEQTLRTWYPGRRIEVLNLGIPQLRMENILALAATELPSLQPDLITFYEGYNDAMMPKRRSDAGIVYRVKDWFYFHSVGWRVVHSRIRAVYMRVTGWLNRDLISTHGLDLPITLDRTRVEAVRSAMRREFAGQLAQLADLAARLNATLILVTQTMTWHNVNEASPWPTYEEEVAAIARQYDHDGVLSARDAVLLAHADLQTELRTLAAARTLLLVDGIRLLDVDRRANMASPVHLTPTGNQRLAMGIADAIAHLPVTRSNLTAERDAP